MFPDNLLYDPQENIWIKEAPNQLVLGITCIYASFAGRLQAVNLKPLGAVVEKGRSVATVESPRFFGPVKTPVSGKLIEINENLVRKPLLANREPYSDGWFAKIRPVGNTDIHSLRSVKEAEPFLRDAIHTFLQIALFGLIQPTDSKQPRSNLHGDFHSSLRQHICGTPKRGIGKIYVLVIAACELSFSKCCFAWSSAYSWIFFYCKLSYEAKHQ